MPQNAAAETELRNLAAIPFQLISPANNAPIIGIYQDNLLGSYRFTRSEMVLTPRHAMNLLMMYPNVDPKTLFANGQRVTNFDVLSQIMPPLTIKYKTKLWDADKKDDPAISNDILEIKNGQYIRGQIEKSVVGSSTKGLVHRVCNDFGNMAASDFIDNLQNIVTEYMKTSSYSVGVSDLMSNRETSSQIIQVIKDKKLDVGTLIQKVHTGIFENNTSHSNKMEFETQVNNILNDATKETDKISRKSLNPNNRFLMIVNSGSKGSLINISHMISCLGQVNVDGKRVPYGFDSRSLPHFCKYDDSPNARGFIENSYINGLTAPELFFHAMGGRIGLIDTAVKSVTWETPIVVLVDKKPIYTEIGKWIDSQLDAEHNKSSVQHFKERNMELLNLTDGNVFVPTTCENGHVTWEEITAITRHDPGDVLYEIKSLGGRSVIVTESKSLLIWDDAKNGFFEKPTPEIKVGDCVPVTSSLCEPPVVLDSVLLPDYLPKSEYLYGTDFNKAVNMMQSAMESRKKIPAGWWEEHNGTEFTLPYSKKSSLQRTVSRSNVGAIQGGGVYPYHAKRIESFVSETFDLSEENGIFIGLFLADGNVHGEHVHITKNNKEVQEFVKAWFTKRSIQFTLKERVNNAGGVSTTISANSAILATFLTRFVGSGAAKKHIPSEAYIANLEFVKGLLNGYFSGDGTVSKNSIEASSASSRLIEGINMMCSRLGIFGKVFRTQLKTNNFGTKHILPSYRISIRAQWGKVFSEKIALLEPNKQRKLSLIKWREFHSNFKTHNDVVLDPIVEINLVSVEKHPKVYDLTIPTTLNFGLANGLQVRDTSQTGYIQRRLIKGLEDLKVEYDMTVRNSKGKIVQFAYGDDGFDPMRVENQSIPLVSMTTQDIYLHYDMNESNSVFMKGTVTRHKKQQAQLKTMCKKWIDHMIQSRDHLVNYVFKSKDDNTVFVPVAFQHIINNIQGQLGLAANSVVDITPLEAFQLIEEYYEKIKSLYYAPPTALFETLYFFYLSPKELLVAKRFHRKGLIVLLETIVLKYKQALVHPGEMVGVVAGQSIGEPTTQLTLNSVTYETELLVRNKEGVIKTVQIGDFTKWGIETSSKIEYMKEKDTTYAELSEYYEVPSATEDGQTVWRRIEAVTKHPVINKDGTNTMLRVTTEGLREVIVTKAKSLLQLVDGKIQGVNGEDLRVGDYLPVSRKPLDFTPNLSLDMMKILDPKEYVYGSEYAKAKSVVDEHQWWSKHANKTFVLPYRRSDTAYCSIKGGDPKKPSKERVHYEPGFVYTLKNSICNYRVPEKIELDYDFGYFIGAYCAEGCMTDHQISIANNDPAYFEPIERLCKKFVLTTKYYVHKIDSETGKRVKESEDPNLWTSSDLRIYSTIMCRIVEKLAGKLSHNKFVSDHIIFSNKECLHGFLDAYIGGDGCVQTSKTYCITASSVSFRMLGDVQLIMRLLGVSSKMAKNKKPDHNSRGTLPENIHQLYELRVTNQSCKILANMLNLKIGYKQNGVELLREHHFDLMTSRKDMFLPNKIDGIIEMQPRDGQMMDLAFEQVVSIEEIPNTTPYAYDLTVEDTRTFDCRNGVTNFDTFHNAGVASKSNVTRGVPRIEEILRLTKHPKNPSLTVHLKPLDEDSQEKAKKFANMLEHTRLSDVVKSLQICFDPDEYNTKIEEDRILMEQFYEFTRLVEECNGASEEPTHQKSKWIVRMEMDTEMLLDKNITMDDIHFAIKQGSYGQEVECVYSDYNSDKLVFRVRMVDRVSNKKKRSAEPLDQSDEIYLLKKFQDDLLANTVLRGIHHIENVIPRKLQNLVTKNDGKYEKKDTWILDTTGTNLMQALGLEYIDATRTYSNDIKEIFDVLGLEAARQVIHNELVEVMEFSGVYINYHHVGLLCDRMTTNKDMVSIFRTGLFNDDIGPIAKATFEVHTEVLLDAARYGEFDHMRGVSANVMCGQNGFYGTNAFQLVLDMNEMNRLEDQMVELEAKTEQIHQAFSELNDRNSDQCPRSKIAVKNNISYMKRVETGLCTDNYDGGF